MSAASVQSLLSHPAYQGWWYYGIELLPGQYTPGSEHRNVALTRHLLRHAVVEGCRCLDIGTMEGLVPVLLSRRAAREVTAVDAYDSSAQIELVKRYTGADFDYHPGIGLDGLATFLAARTDLNYDIVVLSGVLYHVFSPIQTLAVARSLLRQGGLLILETAAVVDDAYAMHFNQAGAVYPDTSSFWFVTAPCLDYLLRYCALAPLHCVYLIDRWTKNPGLTRRTVARMTSGAKRGQLIRLAVICRAVREAVPAAGDEWMQGAVRAIDYAPVAKHLSSGGQPREPVPFELEGTSPYLRPDTGTCDLLRSVTSTAPSRPSQDEWKLSLSDRY